MWGNVPWFLPTAFLPKEEKFWSDHYDLLSSYMVAQMKGEWKERRQEKQSRKEIKKKRRHTKKKKRKKWGIKLCIVKYVSQCKTKCHGVLSSKSRTDSEFESYNRKRSKEVKEKRKNRLRCAIGLWQLNGQGRWKLHVGKLYLDYLAYPHKTQKTLHNTVLTELVVSPSKERYSFRCLSDSWKINSFSALDLRETSRS